MVRDFLALNYYFDEDGNKEKIVNILGNCFDQCAYLIMKNKYNLDITNYYNIFLDNITFYISTYQSDELADLSVTDSEYNKAIYNIINYSNDNEEAYHEIEKLLEVNEMVIVQTVNQMFPFSTFYNPQFSVENFKPGHIFLIIGHSSEYFYFIENSDLIVISNFSSYALNKEVGLIKKELLKNISKHYCKCFTITVNRDNISNCQNNSIKILNDSILDFNKKRVINDNLVFNFGIGAIKKLMEICDEERFNLNAIAPTKDRDLYTYFDWKIWCIKNRRNILKNFLLNDGRFNKKADDLFLISKIENSVNSWEKLFRLMGVKYFRKNFILGKDFRKHFEEILDIEEQLIYLLNELLT